MTHTPKVLLLLAGISVVLSACSQPSAPADSPVTAQALIGGGVDLSLNTYASLQATTPGFTNRVAIHRLGLGATEVVSAASAVSLKQDATWRVVRGLADGNCYSLESLNVPGQYLRHASSRVRRDPNDGSDIFKRDATWCARPGLSGVGVSLESLNFPGRYLRHYAAELWLAQKVGGSLPSDSATGFNPDASWTIAAPFWKNGVALPQGPRMLQVTTPGFTNRFLRHQASLAYTEVVDGGSTDTLKADATFKIVPGLADPACNSFEASNLPGQYLRHSGFRVRIDPSDNSDGFRKDATFCTQPGLSKTGVSLEAFNFPGLFMRHSGGEVWMASGTNARPSDSAAGFEADASWAIASPPPPNPWTVIWRDEFDGAAGTAPSSANWNYDIGNGGEIAGWGNNELEWYTSSTNNVRLDGQGNLDIRAERSTAPLTCWYGNCQYTSGRITTTGKASFQYGKVEARIRVPAGQGLWPAFWSLGNGSSVWPDRGEIDIMEWAGKNPNTIFGTVHGPGYSGNNGVSTTTNLGVPVSNDYHVFTIIKRPNEIIWFVDGRQFHRVTPTSLPAGTRWVFEGSFNMILNLAVGGAFSSNPDASTPFPATMKVDYVRVYREN
jgi:beta-glucanase (GH16 family)